MIRKPKKRTEPHTVSGQPGMILTQPARATGVSVLVDRLKQKPQSRIEDVLEARSLGISVDELTGDL